MAFIYSLYQVLLLIPIVYKESLGFFSYKIMS